MLVLGLWLTVRSGVASVASWSGIRLIAQNFSQALLMIAGCLVGLIVLQQLVGYRIGTLW